VAIGRLASLKTSLSTGGVNKNAELYSFSGVLSNISVHITNQGLEDAKIFVGIASGNISNVSQSDYLIYNKDVERNGNITLSNIGIKSGDVLFCKSSKADVSFIVQSTFDYNNVLNYNFSTGISTSYGKEGSGITTETGFVINRNFSLFTSKKNSLVSIKIINQNVSEECRFFVGLSSVGASDFSSKDYIIYNKKLKPREEYILEDIGVGINQSIIARANKTNVSFNVSSVPANAYEGLINFNTIGIGTQWTTSVAGIHTSANIGIGSATPSSKLDVSGDIKTSGDIKVSGNANVSGIVTSGPLNAQSLTVTGVTTSSGGFVGNVSGAVNTTGISTFGSLLVGVNTNAQVRVSSGSTALIVSGDVNVSGMSSVNNLYVSGNLLGPGVESTILAYAIVFGS
jgi:hypothetical protein